MPAKPSQREMAELLEGMIPGYGYSGEAEAHRTDEKLCSIIVLSCREAKARLFRALHEAFEHHQPDLSGLETLRDEVDSFSDRVKARTFSWKPPKSLSALVSRDYVLMADLGRFRAGIMEIGQEELPSASRSLLDELKSLEDLFMERDRLCNRVARRRRA